MSDTESVYERDRVFWLSIVRNIPAMVFVKEASELRFELFNPAGEALLGVSQADLVGKNDYDFFPRDQADFFTETDRKVLAGKSVVDVEEPIKTPHGERWLNTRKVPILDAAGQPLYLLGISLDITERKQAEAALVDRNRKLEEKEAELRRALDQVLAIEGMVMTAARAAETAQGIVQALDAGDTARARSLAVQLAQEAQRTPG
ncbi:MAG TPA: PAS domain-containing protein [Polyangiaceae bacterium]|nr:PAS domain-containing protein [Polyangiaceae bacterium]